MSGESLDPYEIACLELGIEHTSAQSRIDAGRSIISLMKSSNLNADERQLLSNLLLKLSVDQVKIVREAIISDVSGLPNLAEDLVFSIIADDDELALPFLAITRSLNTQMMNAIAKVGDSGRKLVIAARGDCPAEAASILIKTATPDIVAELLCNFAVVLNDRQYEEIVDLHGTDKTITEHLARRPDLPARLKVKMAQTVSEEMRTKMDTTDVASTIRTQRAIDVAEEEAILQIASSTNSAERAGLMTYLCDRQQLTPSLILRAACTGEMAVVESALSLLSGLQPTRVRNLMYGQGALSLRAVHSRAKLPKVLFDPLRVASDVHKARESARQPKSKDHFGKQMVEAILTHYESFAPEHRKDLLQIIQSYGSPKSRELAQHLLSEQDVGIRTALAA